MARYARGDWSELSLRRSAPGGQLISLEEARRIRQGSAVRPLTRWEPGNLIPWPFTATIEQADGFGTLHHRGHFPLRRWLPTIAFVGLLAALVLLVPFIYAALLSVSGLAGPQPVAPTGEPAAPYATESLAPQVSAPQVQFTLRVLEPAYTVVAGDTLSSIAQRHSTTVQAFRGINNLPESAVLSVGQRLYVP